MLALHHLGLLLGADSNRHCRVHVSAHRNWATHEAFIMLLLRHEAGIRALIRTVVHRTEDVDEVMQAVSLVAWRKFDSLTHREGLGRWACVIARYEALKFLRARARDRFVLDTDLVERILSEGEAESAARSKRLSLLERCLDQLPESRREFLLQAYTPGCTTRAMAERLGLADPGLLAWFPFERGDNPSLLVNAVREHGLLDGRIVGAHWATGRWPGKQALWFDRDSDFVEIEIPGEHAELTVVVWLKVDRFEREFSAILNSNGAEEGGYHLQMNRHGLPRGGLLGVARPNQRWVGHPVPTGKWVHVVSVLSVTQRRHRGHLKRPETL